MSHHAGMLFTSSCKPLHEMLDHFLSRFEARMGQPADTVFVHPEDPALDLDIDYGVRVVPDKLTPKQHYFVCRVETASQPNCAAQIATDGECV